MSIAPAAAHPPLSEGEGATRVRHQARDAATLMLFSALTSVVFAAVFLGLASLVDKG